LLGQRLSEEERSESDEYNSRAFHFSRLPFVADKGEVSENRGPLHVDRIAVQETGLYGIVGNTLV
jgi:hypothetical protein